MTLKLETLRELLRQSTNDVSERYFEQMLEAIAVDFIHKDAYNEEISLDWEATDKNEEKGRFVTAYREDQIFETFEHDIYGQPSLKVSYSKEYEFQYERATHDTPSSESCTLHEVFIDEITLTWFENEFIITGFDSVRKALIEFLQE